MQYWWKNLGFRERQFIGIGSIATGLLLLWAFVWHPLALSRTQLTQTVASQRQALATMQVEAATIQRLRSQGSQEKVERQGKSLLALVDSTARSTSLVNALKQVEPLSGKSVRVTFESASFDALMTWLENLARNFNVHAIDFSVNRIEGVGLVNARISLEEP